MQHGVKRFAFQHFGGFKTVSKDVSDFFVYQIDLKTKSAVERQLGIIGEAVNQFNKEAPEIVVSNSPQIIDFRNLLIHAYDQLDDTIVWAILKRHIPILQEEIKKMLE